MEFVLRALRDDLFGRWLAACGLLRIAQEHQLTLTLHWPRRADRAAVLEGDLDELVEAVAEDARRTAREGVWDLRDHPAWLLGGQQRFSTTCRACLGYLTSPSARSNIREDLLTDGVPVDDVTTLRLDPTRLQPAALSGVGGRSRGVPTQEYLALRGLALDVSAPFYERVRLDWATLAALGPDAPWGGDTFTSGEPAGAEVAMYRDGHKVTGHVGAPWYEGGGAHGPARMVWPVWTMPLRPETALAVLPMGREAWQARGLQVWTAKVRRSESGYHGEVAPGKPL